MFWAQLLLRVVPLVAGGEDPLGEAGSAALQRRLRAECAANVRIEAPRDAQWVRALDENAVVKERYVAFLKERYGYNIGRLNEAYGIEAGAFTELLSERFGRLDARRPAVREDDREFLVEVVPVLLAVAASGCPDFTAVVDAGAGEAVLRAAAKTAAAVEVKADLPREQLALERALRVLGAKGRRFSPPPAVPR
ncbi:MAG: hypothetical protein MUC42_17805 [Bryobacter sp.]|nr:hypothetical protein [Bryobacter sp.]